MNTQHSLRPLFVLFALAIGAPCLAVSLGQVDNFQDGTSQGWSSPFADPTPPVNQPNSGPNGVGDNALFIEAAGFESIAIQNSSQWAGDYLAAGVDELAFDFENLSADALSLGAILSGPGGSAITLTTQIIPISSPWTGGSIDLNAGNLVPLSGTVASTLANVTDIELNLIVSGATLISAGPLEFRLDNIRAVPEPSTFVLLVTLSCLLRAQRR